MGVLTGSVRPVLYVFCWVADQIAVLSIYGSESVAGIVNVAEDIRLRKYTVTK